MDDLDMVTSIIIHFYLYRVIFVYKEHLQFIERFIQHDCM